MISFLGFGSREMGQLGNQLFQYAYLRLQARRLGVRFHCPPWIGDEALSLDDADERAPPPRAVRHRYRPPAGVFGFDPGALEIDDGTDVSGYFQSERYFAGHAEAVRRWYRIRRPHRDEAEAWAERRLPGVDLSRAVSLHLRLSNDYENERRKFPRYGRAYYREALEQLGHDGPVLVFSDRVDRARRFLDGFPADLHYEGGLGALATLHLIGRCGAHVLTNSTFAWWGAWLNPEPGRRVVLPVEWVRAGSECRDTDMAAAGWTARPALSRWDPPYPKWVVRDLVVRQGRRALRRVEARRGQSPHG